MLALFAWYRLKKAFMRFILRKSLRNNDLRKDTRENVSNLSMRKKLENEIFFRLFEFLCVRSQNSQYKDEYVNILA